MIAAVTMYRAENNPIRATALVLETGVELNRSKLMNSSELLARYRFGNEVELNFVVKSKMLDNICGKHKNSVDAR
jgi:hypothetical protein